MPGAPSLFLALHTATMLHAMQQTTLLKISDILLFLRLTFVRKRDGIKTKKLRFIKQTATQTSY